MDYRVKVKIFQNFRNKQIHVLCEGCYREFHARARADLVTLDAKAGPSLKCELCGLSGECQTCADSGEIGITCKECDGSGGQDLSWDDWEHGEMHDYEECEACEGEGVIYEACPDCCADD